MQKRHLSILFLFFFSSIFSALFAQGLVLSTLGLGIPSDGRTLCTAALQQAIDSIGAKGGGELVLTPGTYLTGGLTLRSGVTLRLQKGATLLGSANPYDYTRVDAKASASDPNNDNGTMALLMAKGARGIAIVSEGVIDGNGLQLALNVDSLHHTGERPDPNYNVRRQRPSGEMRPKLFFFAECDGVSVRGGSYKNSACWGLSFDLCSHMTLEDIDVENRAYWNNDGIDITDCQHVSIARCRVNAADDGICLKSYHTDAANKDISIANCEIRSSASAVKFGTGSWGGFEDIEIANITVRDTYRSAIAIESVDGARVKNVLVHDVHAINTGNPFFIRLGQRAGNRKGSISGVVIKNLYCEVPFGRPDADYDLRGPGLNDIFNPIPSSITGIGGNNVADVTLENVEVLMPGRGTKGTAYIPLWRVDDVPEKVASYPEYTMFGELPAYGIYVRHVDSLTLRNVRIRLSAPDYRPAIVLSDVGRLTTENVVPQDLFRK